MISSIEEAQSAPALVVDRWNSWVRVWFPDTGELAWLNLDERPFEMLSDSPDETAGPKRASGLEA